MVFLVLTPFSFPIVLPVMMVDKLVSGTGFLQIHTISRSQLLFRIDHQFGPGEYEELINKLKKALDLKA
jgi:hypothetical protein